MMDTKNIHVIVNLTPVYNHFHLLEGWKGSHVKSKGSTASLTSGGSARTT